MRILGVDPALHTTGYGLIDVDKRSISLVEAGVIQTKPKEILPERLKKIHTQILALIDDTSPDVLVLEKLYAHYRHPTTAFILGEARGVTCLACAQRRIPMVEYGATRVKKALVGKGLAAKYQVQRMVAEVLHIDNECMPKYMDVSDALALAIAHSYIARTKL